MTAPSFAANPAARALHERAVVVDCHNDLPVATLLHYHDADIAHDWAARWLPELRAGGVDVQVLPIWLSPHEAERGLRRALIAIEMLRRGIDAHPDDLALCRTGAEIRAAVATGRIAVLISLEGIAYVNNDIELFGSLATLGVRMIALTHMGRTMLADGSGEDAAGGRLTARGVEAIAELERQGILVDVSHLGASSVDHLLDVATKPVVASHSAARTLRDHHRNLTDDQLRRVAATGGVVAVNFTPVHIRAEGKATAADAVAHIRHIADVIGPESTGLGPDFVAPYFRWAYPMFTGAEIGPWDYKMQVELDGPADLPAITDGLLAAGFSDDEVIGILGENLLRLFDRVLVR